MRSLIVAILLSAVNLAFGQTAYRELPLYSGTFTTNNSGAQVSTGVAANIGYNSAGGRIYINCTAVTGTTPSITPRIQGLVNGVWHTLIAGTAITSVATSLQNLSVGEIPDIVRADWTSISGTTPSFTCTMDLVRQ